MTVPDTHPHAADGASTDADDPHAAAGLSMLEPIRYRASRWPRVLATLLTGAMLIGLARELLDQGLTGLTRTVPRSPWFYLLFLLSYLTTPVVDFVIFRRLWQVPAAAFGALNLKRVANDLLIGVTGDAYFYAWARTRLKMVTAPFGAVKDVSILSGLAGNTAALLLAAVALPLGHRLIDPEVLHAMLWSLGVTGAVVCAVLFLSPIVFSLRRRDLWWIYRWSIYRIGVSSLLLAVAWHFAMPGVSVFMWVFLMAGRLLVSRLPFLPNKDLLFANFAILVIGQDRALSELMAFTAASTLLAHIAATIVFGAGFLWEKVTAWRRSG
jgi:hypothetical protein